MSTKKSTPASGVITLKLGFVPPSELHQAPDFAALYADILKRKHGADNAAAHAARNSLLAAHGDPFSGAASLDHTARRKRELYQQLFYMLQTRSEYLSRLFYRMFQDNVAEKDRRFTERVVLTLFGFGQDRREDYLLLRLFQVGVNCKSHYSVTNS